MSADDNKKLVQVAFDALSEAYAEPFLGLLADPSTGRSRARPPGRAPTREKPPS